MNTIPHNTNNPIERIIIFTDFSTLLVPTILINATVKAVTGMKHFQIAGICVRNYQKYHHLMYRHSRTILKTKIKTFFDKTQHQKFSCPLPINIDRLAWQHRFKVLIPPDNNINHPEFIQQVKTQIQPTVALSFFCLQKFSLELLQTFEYAVNYHNGILPKYRGLRATCWSVYHQDSTTGYTYHRINEKINQGNTLIKGMLPVQADTRVPDLEYKKPSVRQKIFPVCWRSSKGEKSVRSGPGWKIIFPEMMRKKAHLLISRRTIYMRS